MGDESSVQLEEETALHTLVRHLISKYNHPFKIKYLDLKYIMRKVEL